MLIFEKIRQAVDGNEVDWPIYAALSTPPGKDGDALNLDKTHLRESSGERRKRLLQALQHGGGRGQRRCRRGGAGILHVRLVFIGATVHVAVGAQVVIHGVHVGILHVCHGDTANR